MFNNLFPACQVRTLLLLLSSSSVYNGFNFRDPVLANLVYALNNGREP